MVRRDRHGATASTPGSQEAVLQEAEAAAEQHGQTNYGIAPFSNSLFHFASSANYERFNKARSVSSDQRHFRQNSARLNIQSTSLVFSTKRATSTDTLRSFTIIPNPSLTLTALLTTICTSPGAFAFQPTYFQRKRHARFIQDLPQRQRRAQAAHKNFFFHQPLATRV
jgi:hypothetical protein